MSGNGQGDSGKARLSSLCALSAGPAVEKAVVGTEESRGQQESVCSSTSIRPHVDEDFNPPERTLVSLSLGRVNEGKILGNVVPAYSSLAEVKAIAFESKGNLHKRSLSKHGLFNKAVSKGLEVGISVYEIGVYENVSRSALGQGRVPARRQ